MQARSWRTPTGWAAADQSSSAPELLPEDIRLPIGLLTDTCVAWHACELPPSCRVIEPVA